MIPHPHRSLLLVVSAPSGAGKTTLCDRLLTELEGVRRVVTCTTRAPRGTEVDGRDYHFLTDAEFRCRIRAGAFLEHARVHDHRYGTPRADVDAIRREGRDALLVIDVQGAARIRRLLARSGDAVLRSALVDVFVVPPSLKALRERLTGRGTDSAATVRLRLRNARRELARWSEYRYVVVNDRVEQAVDHLRAIVLAEHARVMARQR